MYGLHVEAVPRVPLDLEVVTRVLLDNNVKLDTHSRYYLGEQTKTGLVFGYGKVDLVEIGKSIPLLRRAY